MADDFTILRYVSWRDICPWMILAKVFRAAIAARVIALSFAATLLMTGSWNFASTCCLNQDSLDDEQFAAFRSLVEGPASGTSITVDDMHQVLQSPSLGTLRQMSPVTSCYVRLSAPFVNLFDRQTSLDRWCYLLVGGILSALIWSFFGLAIARIAVVRIGRGEIISLTSAVGFAMRKWLSCFLSPMMPFVTILLLALPLMAAGVAMRSDVGTVFVGIFWIIVLIAGLFMTGLAIGLLFGWPLMWGAIATESSDAFDAVSRSFSYTFSKPLHYLLYAMIGIILGALGWIVVWFGTECVIQLSGWAVSIGTGEQRWDTLGNAMKDVASDVPASRSIGVWLIGIANAAVRTIVASFNFSFFWTFAVAMYLLLRMATDQTEFDEIYFADEDSSVSPLPQFETDAAGGPSSSS